MKYISIICHSQIDVLPPLEVMDMHAPDIAIYLERWTLRLYIDAQGIDNGKRKHALLLSLAGMSVQDTYFDKIKKPAFAGPQDLEVYYVIMHYMCCPVTLNQR